MRPALFLTILLLVSGNLSPAQVRTSREIAPPSAIMAFDISPDGRWIAAFAADGKCILWDVTRGTRTELWKGNGHSLDAIAFSPDSRRVALGDSDGIIHVIEIPSGLLLITMKGSMEWIEKIVFSGDGTKLAALHTGGVSVWKLDDAQEVRSIPDQDTFGAVALNYDATQLATGSNKGPIRLWNVSSGQAIQTLTLDSSDFTNDLLFTHQDAWLISAQGNGDITIWAVATGQKIRTIQGHREQVEGVAIHPNTRTLVSLADDETVRTWNIETGKLETTWKTSFDLRPGILSVDGRFVLRRRELDDGQLDLWRVSSRRKVRSFRYISPGPSAPSQH
jgi:WD40 repeat protein